VEVASSLVGVAGIGRLLCGSEGPVVVGGSR
jgi:hypothetical protein